MAQTQVRGYLKKKIASKICSHYCKVLTFLKCSVYIDGGSKNNGWISKHPINLPLSLYCIQWGASQACASPQPTVASQTASNINASVSKLLYSTVTKHIPVIPIKHNNI
jgi:hypothetical protein